MKLRVRCVCGGEPDFTVPTDPVCMDCQKPGHACTCDSHYARIGRALVAFHDWQEEADDRRPLTFRRNRAHPHSEPEEIADGLERLVKMARISGPNDSVRVDAWQGGPAE